MRKHHATRLDTIRFDSITFCSYITLHWRFEAIRFDSLRFDSIRSDSTRFGSVRFSSIRFDPTQPSCNHHNCHAISMQPSCNHQGIITQPPYNHQAKTPCNRHFLYHQAKAPGNRHSLNHPPTHLSLAVRRSTRARVELGLGSGLASIKPPHCIVTLHRIALHNLTLH